MPNPPHLRRRKNTFFANIGVPTMLRVTYGKATIEESLRTSDLQEAIIRRDLWLSEKRAEFRDVERQAIVTAAELERLQASRVRESFDAALRQPWKGESEIGIRALRMLLSEADEETKLALSEADIGAVELFRKGLQPPPAPPAATPLLEPLDKWGNAKVRTINERRMVVRRFHGWAAAKGIETFEAVTRKIAAEYIAEGLTGLSARTVSKHCIVLSGYWRFALDTGAFEGANPWDRQPRPKVQPTAKRAWSDDELRALLAGNPGEPLADAIMIAACSGMRIEELCQLRVTDCADGIINVRSGKTPAARRTIPIHSALSAIIEARCNGREPDEYLLGELGEPKGDLERSHGLSIAFKDYRRSVGLDDPATDFHSLRRRFADMATKALESGSAGFTELALKEVLGHAHRDITGHYAGKRGIDTKRAVVEAVALPNQPS